MIKIYQTHTNIFNEKLITWENEDGSRSWANSDQNNPNYQAYLAWVEMGNTAEEWNPGGSD